MRNFRLRENESQGVLGRRERNEKVKMPKGGGKFFFGGRWKVETGMKREIMERESN